MFSLSPPRSSTRLGRLLTPGLLGQRPRFVGIDVGVQQVRTAGFGTGRGERRLGWLAASEFELPIDPTAPPPADWVERVAELLSDRLPRCVDGEANLAMISLPLPWIHYEVVAGEQIVASRQQCDAMFAASLFQSPAHVCHWPLDASNEYQVLAATADTAAVRIAEAVAEVGYDVAGILPHGVALAHAAKPLTAVDAICGVLLEPSGGLVTMFDGEQSGLCRGLPPHEEVTALFGSGIDVVDLQPWLEQIAEEVNATCRYSERLGEVGGSDRPGEPDRSRESDRPVLIAGAVAAVPEVDVVLAQYLERPVAKWSYAGSRRPVSDQLHPADSLAEQDPCRAMPLSLAFAAASRSAGGLK